MVVRVFCRFFAVVTLALDLFRARKGYCSVVRVRVVIARSDVMLEGGGRVAELLVLGDCCC